MILQIAMGVCDLAIVVVALHLVRCEQVELYWPARYFTSFDQRIALAMQERIAYDQLPEIVRCHHLSWRAVDQLVNWVISSDFSLAAIDPMQVQINRCQAAGDQAHAAVDGRERQAGYAPLTSRAPHPAGDGAYYTVDLNGGEHRMWLCGVTEFVFGAMPDRIYYRNAG